MLYHALLLKQRGTNPGLSTSLHTERRQGPIRRKMGELDTGSLGFGGRQYGSFVYSYVLRASQLWISCWLLTSVGET